MQTLMLLFQNNVYPSWRDLMMLTPELVLLVFACFALVLDVILPQGKKRITAYISLIGVIISGISILQLLLKQKGTIPRLLFYEMYVVDYYALLFKGIFLLGGALSIAISIKYLDTEEEHHGDYYALMLFALTGMMFMASSYDLLMVYVSLELMAISIYVLVGYLRRNNRSNEAAMKYFLLGAFSSAIMLYGMSLIYGATGQTNLRAIGESLPLLVSSSTGNIHYFMLLAMLLMLVGLLFKVAAVPFHMWAPDAYEGAPTSVTAFMSVGVKAASYAILARILLVGMLEMQQISAAQMPGWAGMLAVIAAITMTVGNIAAMTQSNTKRMLAYSAVAQAGYVLLGLVATNDFGYVGVVLYLIAYTVMNLGAFGVIILLRRDKISGEKIEHLNGLMKKSPAVAIAMLIFMLSLAGFPPTAGFIGKYYLFAGLIKTGNEWYTRLAVVAIINTVISMYYYARVIKAMFIENISEDTPITVHPAMGVALTLTAVLTLAIGLYPAPFIRVSEAAIRHVTVPVKEQPTIPVGIDLGQP